MRAGHGTLFSLLPLQTGVVLIAVPRLMAQPLTNLHSFTGGDGAFPNGGLIVADSTLYETTFYGGSFGGGTIFKVNTDGSGFTNLHSFTDATTNSDGSEPFAGLVLSGSTLYGTAYSGGRWGNGTVFRINADSTGFTNLHSFTATAYDSHNNLTNGDGSQPSSGLVLSGGSLYGTASSGGGSGGGVVFRVNVDGTGFTNLHSFIGAPDPAATNGDGATPFGALILSGNTLYGTTAYTTVSGMGSGTIFKVVTNGAGFAVLHRFTATAASSPYTNSDGASPDAPMILSGSTLYGTTLSGGTWGGGAIFRVSTDGTGFVNIHSFGATASDPNNYYTNWDGAYPKSRLILLGNGLLGAAQKGGSSGDGTVFELNTDGTEFTTLYSFTAPYFLNGDGAVPKDVASSGEFLYGTSDRGGSGGIGTVFGLFVPPKVAITRSVSNIVLTWPTNYFDFTLQSTTNLHAPGAWSTVSPVPVEVNGQNAVTNPASGREKYFRLSH